MIQKNEYNQLVRSELALALFELSQDHNPNSVRASAANLLNSFNNNDDQSFIIEQTLLKLESLQGVRHNRSTGFNCLYHFNYNKESNLLNFFNEISKLEESLIIGHWVWVKKPNNIKQLKEIGFRKVTDKNSVNYGFYYINPYMVNFRWNSLQSIPVIVRKLHR